MYTNVFGSYCKLSMYVRLLQCECIKKQFLLIYVYSGSLSTYLKMSTSFQKWRNLSSSIITTNHYQSICLFLVWNITYTSIDEAQAINIKLIKAHTNKHSASKNNFVIRPWCWSFFLLFSFNIFIVVNIYICTLIFSITVSCYIYIYTF